MPLRSMTGFGVASREGPGLQVRTEVRSVNHRGLAVTVRAPSFFDGQVDAIESAVKRRVARGTVTVSVSAARRTPTAPSRLADGVLDAYAAQAAAAADRLGLAAPTVGDLLRLPGVLEEAPAEELEPDDAATALASVEAALDSMVAMREREGLALQGELRALAEGLAALAARVETLTPAAVATQADRLRQRLGELLGPGRGVPDELVAREVAVLADRTDVAEEVARLESHLTQWLDALTEGGPVGRRLEFLTQELGREANTIGSKCQDAEITRLVVEMKVVVERLKEQAANIE